MNCYNCGCELSEKDYCTACGADVGIYKKILSLSYYYYNEGLKKAQVRDLTGAAESLRQSLKCHKYNIEARNLLGLVYFEMGEAVDAVGEWIISKNYQPKKNLADDFLNIIQENPTKWDSIRQTIKKYNQGLEYCRQDSIDLAIIQLKSVVRSNPKMIRGRLLLALVYLYTEDWERAIRHIETILKIDTNNTTALYYLKQAEDALAAIDAENEAAGKKKKKPKRRDVIKYTSGNETIIQPINNPEKTGYAVTVLNIAVGLIIGLAIMWFLVLPARIKIAQENADSQVRKVSGELTEKSVSMDELNKRIEALEAENSALMARDEQITGSDGLISATDMLMNAAKAYMDDSEASLDIARMLSGIDKAYVEGDISSSAFQMLYNSLYSEVAPKACEKLKDTADGYIESEKYSSAIELLSEAIAIAPSDSQAYLALADAYRLNNNKADANQIYRQIVDNFSGSDAAKKAQKYLEGAEVEETAEEPAAQENSNEQAVITAPEENAAVVVETPLSEVTEGALINPTEEIN